MLLSCKRCRSKKSKKNICVTLKRKKMLCWGVKKKYRRLIICNYGEEKEFDWSDRFAISAELFRKRRYDRILWAKYLPKFVPPANCGQDNCMTNIGIT